MRIIFLLLISLFLSGFLTAQSDTIGDMIIEYSRLPDRLFDKHYPNNIPINSQVNVESKNKGYELLSFTMSDCDKNSYDPYRQLDRVVYSQYNNDTLDIEISFPDLCCAKYLGEIEIQGDTLNLIKQNKGGSCGCMCCYSVHYRIKTKLYNDNQPLKLNGKSIDRTGNVYPPIPIKFDIDLDGDTINLYDKYGVPQGMHKTYFGRTLTSIRIYGQQISPRHGGPGSFGLPQPPPPPPRNDTSQTINPDYYDPPSGFVDTTIYQNDGKLMYSVKWDNKQGQIIRTGHLVPDNSIPSPTKPSERSNLMKEDE